MLTRMAVAAGAALLGAGALAVPASAAPAAPAGTSSYQEFRDIGGGSTQFHSTRSHYAGRDAQTCILATGYDSSAWDLGYNFSLRADPSHRKLWESPTYHGDHQRCSPWVNYRGKAYTRVTTYEYSHLKSAKVWDYRN